MAAQLFDHAGKSSNKPSSFEVQQLETQMAHNKLLHAKATAERQRHMTNLTKASRTKLMRNEELRCQVTIMASAVETQAPSLMQPGKSKSIEKCVPLPAAERMAAQLPSLALVLMAQSLPPVCASVAAIQQRTAGD